MNGGRDEKQVRRKEGVWKVGEGEKVILGI